MLPELNSFKDIKGANCLQYLQFGLPDLISTSPFSPYERFFSLVIDHAQQHPMSPLPVLSAQTRISKTSPQHITCLVYKNSV